MNSFSTFIRFLLSGRSGALITTISWLSMLGVWLGVGALILILSVMNGFNKTIKSRLVKFEPHVEIVIDKVSVDDLDNHEIKQYLINKYGDKIQVEPFEFQEVILRSPDNLIQQAIAKGLSPDKLNLLVHAQTGASITDQASLKTYYLGVNLADTLGVFEGDTLVVIPPETLLKPAGEFPVMQKIQVDGFIKTDIDSIDERALYYPFGHGLERLSGSAGVARGFHLWMKEPKDSFILKSDLQKKFPSSLIKTWEDKNAALFFALKVEKFVIGLLVGLSSLIAGFSVITVMSLLVNQKKKEIGIMMAMGYSPEGVNSLFKKIGLYLALSGVLLGLITGVSLALCVNSFSKDFLPDFYLESNIPTELNYLQILTVLAVAVVLAYVVVSIAMKSLLKLSPSEAIRGQGL